MSTAKLSATDKLSAIEGLSVAGNLSATEGSSKNAASEYDGSQPEEVVEEEVREERDRVSR